MNPQPKRVLFFKARRFKDQPGYALQTHRWHSMLPEGEDGGGGGSQHKARLVTDERTRKQGLTNQRLQRQHKKVVRQLIKVIPIKLTPITDTKGGRAAAFDFAIALAEALDRQGERIKNISGFTIRLGVNGLKHAKQLTGDIRTAALFYHLSDLLKQAIYVKSEHPDQRKQQRKPNIMAYHKLAIPVDYQGDQALAILHVEQDDKGNIYYQGEIAELTKPAGISMSDATPSVQGQGQRQASLSEYIHQLLQVKRKLSYLATFAPKIQSVPLTKASEIRIPGTLIWTGRTVSNTRNGMDALGDKAPPPDPDFQRAGSPGPSAGVAQKRAPKPGIEGLGNQTNDQNKLPPPNKKHKPFKKALILFFKKP